MALCPAGSVALGLALVLVLLLDDVPGVVVVEVVEVAVVVNVVVTFVDPEQIPNAGWHPSPHQASPLPQYQYSEQHWPPPKPVQVVVLPHIPSRETVSEAVGAGEELVVEELEELDVEVEVLAVLVVDVVETLPHAP